MEWDSGDDRRIRRLRSVIPSARSAVRKLRRVSRRGLPRPFVSALRVRSGKAASDLLRSGSCRECGLVARHRVQVLIVLIIVHSE